MRTANFALILLAVGALAGCASGSRPSGASAVERGHYLARIMDCTGCHTPGALVGRPDTDRYLAGADVGFGTPLGIVYPPNLTPDPVTGLGRWTDAEIARAIRQGVRPDGRALVPVMPWPSYSALTEADVAASSPICARCLRRATRRRATRRPDSRRRRRISRSPRRAEAGRPDHAASSASPAASRSR
jgi:mono/diheme cytochrome c family protein